MRTKVSVSIYLNDQGLINVDTTRSLAPSSRPLTMRSEKAVDDRSCHGPEQDQDCPERTGGAEQPVAE